MKPRYYGMMQTTWTSPQRFMDGFYGIKTASEQPSTEKQDASKNPNLVAFMELIRHRSNSTMSLLRLPSPISLTSVSLVFDTTTMVFFLPTQWVTPYTHRSWIIRVRTIRKSVSRVGGGRLSQVPVETYCTFALLLDPGRNATPHLIFLSFSI